MRKTVLANVTWNVSRNTKNPTPNLTPNHNVMWSGLPPKLTGANFPANLTKIGGVVLQLMWSVVHTGPAVWRQCGRVGSFPRWWRTKCQLWSSRRTSWRSTCLERRSSTAATATRLCPANLLCKFTHFSNDSSSMNMQIINDDASVVERRYHPLEL